MQFGDVLHPVFSWGAVLSIFVITALLVIPIVLASMRFGIEGPVKIDGRVSSKELSFAGQILCYSAWTLVQQLIMYAILTTLDKRFPGLAWNPAIAAGIFALFHFPNYMLMFLCLGGGLVLCIHYQEYHNIILTAVGQATVAMVVLKYTPQAITTKIRIFWGYEEAQRELMERLRGAERGDRK